MDELNSSYERVLKSEMSIFKAYSEMVEQYPYRVLASYSYDKEERPLRSQRVAANPVQSETASDLDSVDYRNASGSQFQDISSLRDHDDFIQMLINGKAMAQLNNKPYTITWRGYSTNIDPEFLMTKSTLKNELISALKNLVSITKEEEKV